MKPRELVVEDDAKVLSALARGLTLEGYDVEAAEDGPGGLALAQTHPPDVVVLDVMLPGMSGLEVCDRLRRTGSPPILLLTARDSIADRVAGLDRGADDYLVKPFAFDELLARLRALIRRRYRAPSNLLQIGDLELDAAGRAVRRAGRAIALSAREYAL